MNCIKIGSDYVDLLGADSGNGQRKHRRQLAIAADSVNDRNVEQVKYSDEYSDQPNCCSAITMDRRFNASATDFSALRTSEILPVTGSGFI